MEGVPKYMKIDMKKWPRREHFLYYQNQIPCSLSVTCRVDVTALLEYAHQSGRHFTPCLLYAVSKTVNEMDSMKMMETEEGQPGIWERTNPVFTVFHPDDETFSDLWMDYYPDFEDFYREYVSVVDQYGRNKGVKGREGQPANFFCFSSVPWLDFTGCSNSGGKPTLFPIIDCGKYRAEERSPDADAASARRDTRRDIRDIDGASKHMTRYTMPVAITISHAAADGYHISQFFRKMQENIDFFQKVPDNYQGDIRI